MNINNNVLTSKREAKMKLLDLLKGIKVNKIIGKQDINIKDLTCDSNKVVSGSLFFCINGKDFDGHSYVRQAQMYGAEAIVCERQLDIPLTQIVVDNARITMSYIASNFYGNVDKKMKLIAVVGTNGKTTTSHLIYSILLSAGIKCGMIGTLGTYYLDKFIEPTLTTPDPIELYKILYDMYENGIKTVVMEVSAHAIFLSKVCAIKFFCAVFTNFSQDHLDFFKSIDAYKDAKVNFFTQNQIKHIVTNSDDKVGREILNLRQDAITYGMDNPADVFAINISCKEKATSFYINLFDYVEQVKLNMLGFFNVYNALASTCVCSLLGVKSDKIINGLRQFNGVAGRLEKVYSGAFDVVIDYAHTPDGLNKTLLALRPFVSNRLICVFGCGGNRDQTKRKIMGEISASLADFTIITSDNPRYEEPMEIISQIEEGVRKKSKHYLMIEDREEAIKHALNIAVKGDVILIAGKGCEKYQEILGIKRLYNDKDTVNEYLRSTEI